MLRSFSKNEPSMLYFKGKTNQYLVPAVGLDLIPCSNSHAAPASDARGSALIWVGGTART